MNRMLLLTAICGVLMWTGGLQARELLGSSESEVAAWAQERGYQALPIASGSSACLKDKRYIAMTGKGLKIYAVFFHPIFKDATKIVASVEFAPETPLSKAKAAELAVQAAPIAGTRPPTHQQAINSDPQDPCGPTHGGFEGRYTEDYIVEYFYALDGHSVERIRVYTQDIR